MEGQLSIFDVFDAFKGEEVQVFCFDNDINKIVDMIREVAYQLDVELGKVEFNIWDHVPQYGYRLSCSVHVEKEQFDMFVDAMNPVIQFGKQNNVEVSVMSGCYFGNDNKATLYVFSTFEDGRRKLKAKDGRKELYVAA